MVSPSLSAIVIGIPDGASEEDLYGEGELARDDPGAPLDVDYLPSGGDSDDPATASDADEAAANPEDLAPEDLGSEPEDSMQDAAELGIEPGGENADPFYSLSSTCEECAEVFRTEDCLGREHPHEELCDHCYAKHYDE